MAQKIFLTIILAVTLPLYSLQFIHNDEPQLNPEELNILTGGKWTGKLTYLDYSSKKEVSISAVLTVSETEDSDIFIFNYEYPKEPEANGSDTLKITDSGKIFGDEAIIEKNLTEDGSMKLVTEREGNDDERPAIFRHTYLINKNNFSVKKEVRFKDENDFFKRNEYEFQR